MGEIVIRLDSDQLDQKAGDLKKIAEALDQLEKRLEVSLANGSPGQLGEFIRSEVRDVRHRTQLTRESAGRQAGELTIRAVLARLANDQGTKADVTVLLSLCAGRNAINPDKRKKLAAAIATLADRIVHGKVAVGKDGKQSPVDLALDRWSQWYTKAKNDGKSIGRDQSLTKLKTTVLGKLVMTFEPGPGNAGNLLASGVLNGGTPPPAVTPQESTPPDAPEVTVPTVNPDEPTVDVPVADVPVAATD